MSQVRRAAAAYADGLRSMLELGERLSDADWAAPTQCPLWSVADIYAHVVGPEQWMAAGGTPYDLPLQQWIDSHVEARHGRSKASVLAELREILPVRQEQLSQAENEPTVFIPRLGRTGPQELGLRMRMFDLFTHEQDVRAATGDRGNLASDGAAVTQELLVQGLPRIVAKVAQVPAGSIVRITVTGELPFEVTYAIADARATPTDQQPDLHLTMTWEAFARLSAGRGSLDDYAVAVAGDEEAAGRVLRALNVAP